MNIFTVSLQAAFTILAVMVIRALFIHHLPKKIFVILWGIVICRLLLPFSIPFHFSIWNLPDAWRTQTANGTITPDVLPDGVLDILAGTASDGTPFGAEKIVTPWLAYPSANGSAGNSGISLLFWLWLAGIFACSMWFLLTHFSCKKVYNTALPVENSLVDLWLAGHPLKRRLCVMQSDKVNSPLTYGILKPVILLSGPDDWRDETRLSYVLTHEYVHIRRFDILWKWVTALTLALHWFNPLVWIMYVLVNRDLELSCDETVVRTCGEKMRSGYALTLLNLVEERSGRLVSLYSNFSKNAVEERIVSIMKPRKFSFITTFAALVLICGVTLVFATNKTAAKGAGLALNNTAGTSNYVEWMFLLSEGESAVKVTHDGNNWEDYPADFTEDKSVSFIRTQENVGNGLKSPQPGTIFIKNGVGFRGPSGKWMQWYTFGVPDLASGRAESPLFETRDGLFVAVKQYYDSEVSAQTITQAEAELLYKKLVFLVRTMDEMTLLEKCFAIKC
jgi:beta-lactamase regulating signal transducer with metallopeptidase domain